MKGIKVVALLAKAGIVVASTAWLTAGVIQLGATEEKHSIAETAEITTAETAAITEMINEETFSLEVSSAPETIWEEPDKVADEDTVVEEPVQEAAEEEVAEEEAIQDFEVHLSEEDEWIILKIAMAEAEGEDLEGYALVMRVVLNRVADPMFPDTVSGVVFQKDQFSPVWNGRYDRVVPDAVCYTALDLIRSGWDDSQGATYFEAGGKSEWHKTHLKFLFVHGGHHFYKEKGE